MSKIKVKVFPKWLVNKLRLKNVPQRAVDFLCNLFKMDRRQIEERYSKYFYEYYRELIEGEESDKNRYALTCHLIAQEYTAKNATLLDLGCGFGLQSILFSLYGNNVIALDISRKKIRTLRKILRYENSNFRVFPIIGSALKLPLRSHSVDFVYSNEVISHLPNLMKCFKEIRRILKGIIIISDTNKLCLKTRYTLAFFQERRKKSRLVYKEMRRKILINYCNAEKKRFPREVIEKIVDATDGFTKKEILQILSAYIEGHTNIMQLAKNFGKRFPYREPTSGIYEERLFTPRLISTALKSMGFVTQTRLPIVAYKPLYDVVQLPVIKEILSVVLYPKYLVVSYRQT